MLYTDIEKKYGFKFPAKFHRILETGALEWAENGVENFRSNMKKYVDDPAAFMMINADCELIFTDVFEEYMQNIEEIKKLGEEYQNLTLNPQYRFIPFAYTGSGDIFCFVYVEDNEPFVILLFHDIFEYEFYGKDFDEFMYMMMLNAASCSLHDGEDYKTETWIKHLDYLSDKYRNMLESSSFTNEEEADAELIKIIDSKQFEIWVEL